jgi:hypothetical protein
MTGLLDGLTPTSKSSPLLTNLKFAKPKRKNTPNDQPTFLLDTMKLSNTFVAAIVAVLISPTIASASATDESPSDDSNYGRKKKPGKNKGKLMENRITVFLATEEEDSEGPDNFELAYLEDNVAYAYNKVQKKGTDLVAVNSHYVGKAKTPGDPGGDVLFPELSKSLGGSGVGNWYYQG